MRYDYFFYAKKKFEGGSKTVRGAREKPIGLQTNEAREDQGLKEETSQVNPATQVLGKLVIG